VLGNGWYAACQINQVPTTAKCLVDMLVAMEVAYQLAYIQLTLRKASLTQMLGSLPGHLGVNVF
jgi:hypothetical protein